MEKLTELMIITMEECGELTQACSKLLRKQDFAKTNNVYSILEDSKQELTKEVADVMCMIELMQEQGLVNLIDIKEGIKSKRNKLKTWSNLIT
jgi:NTP pyrophosphatase (non-canonical NTP hydrolase)|tara:strand:- start:347 stop:625 length:279 start_codon:yes stop_codon:yes gene_type:complete